MWHLWCCSTAQSGGDSKSTNTTPTVPRGTDSPTSQCGGCLKTLVRKLKKGGNKLNSNSRQKSCSFECRYDPMSYSLNFDTTGSGGGFLDEDYYQFYAFSSRFVANRSTGMTMSMSVSCPKVVPTSH